MAIQKIIVFKQNNEEFAIDIQQVERILGYIETTKIPDSPSYIKGVIKYQDTILPVLDLSIKFKKGSNSNLNSKIIVVKNNESSIGLLVDDVSEVIDINEKSIETTPEIVTGYSNQYISGIIKRDDRIIIKIDTEKILSKDELSSIVSL